MSLLSDSDKAQIRAAIKSVTDTFMVTPVVYHLSEGSLDRWQEDKEDEVFVNYLLSGLTEYSNNDGDKVVTKLEGAKDYDDVTISFNLEDLQESGLISSEFDPIFVKEADYFTCRNKVYKVTDAYLDGPLDAKSMLVVIKGKLSDAKRGVDFKVVANTEGYLTTITGEYLTTAEGDFLMVTGTDDSTLTTTEGEVLITMEGDVLVISGELSGAITTISGDTLTTADGEVLIIGDSTVQQLTSLSSN